MPRDGGRAEGRQTEFMPWFQLRKLLIEGPKTEPMTLNGTELGPLIQEDLLLLAHIKLKCKMSELSLRNE